MSTKHVHAQFSVASNLTLQSSLNLTLVTGLTPPAYYHKDSGIYNIKTRVQPYAEAGVDYQHKLVGNYSFIIGLHVTGSGRNTVLNIPLKQINSTYEQVYNSDLKGRGFDFNIAIPILLERRWDLRHYKSVYLQAGLQLHTSLGYDVDSYGLNLQDTSGNNIDVFDLNLNSNNQRKPWITYSAGSGYQLILKNNNLLRIGISVNLSFSHYANGTYQITILNAPQTTGVYHANGSYLALSASYGFTGLNRKLVHRYEE